MEQRVLNAPAVIDGAIAIAYAMFSTTRFGLDAAVQDLSGLLPDHRVDDLVDVLVFSHLGRRGTGSMRRFSFVHRRFNEYFLVQKLKTNPALVPRDDVPSDSRFRDALVLYCEAAGADEAAAVGEFAWEHVRRGDLATVGSSGPLYRAAVHSLRFLSEAFRGRLECLQQFRRELADYIASVMQNADSLVAKKIALEAVGLCDEGEIGRVVVLAGALQNPWIDETAFRSCQYLSTANADVKRELIAMIMRIPLRAFWGRWRDLSFALSLSESLKSVRAFCLMRVMTTVANVVGACLLLSTAPVLLLYILLLPWMFRLFVTLMDRPRRELRLLQAVAGPGVTACIALLFIAAEVGRLFSTMGPGTVQVTMFPARFVSAFSVGGILHAGRTEVALVGALLLLPVHTLIWNPPKVTSWVRRLLATLTREWRVAIVSVGIVAAMGAGMVGAMYLLDTYEFMFLTVIFSIGGAVFGWRLLILCGRMIRRWRDERSDRRTLRDVGLPSSEVRREDVARVWRALSSAKGRAEYASSLRDARVRAIGEWPDGRIPNLENDMASTMLAQLEEIWLGLARR
jgi:hypothetical protein